jgi:hypothetical protein
VPDEKTESDFRDIAADPDLVLQIPATEDQTEEYQHQDKKGAFTVKVHKDDVGDGNSVSIHGMGNGVDPAVWYRGKYIVDATKQFYGPVHYSVMRSQIVAVPFYDGKKAAGADLLLRWNWNNNARKPMPLGEPVGRGITRYDALLSLRMTHQINDDGVINDWRGYGVALEMGQPISRDLLPGVARGSEIRAAINGLLETTPEAERDQTLKNDFGSWGVDFDNRQKEAARRIMGGER